MNRETVISILIICAFFSGCVMDQGPQKGSIQLTSSPPGAEIYLDSQFRGSTPSTITDLETGNHSLEFRYPGYQSWLTTISVTAGTSNFYAALVPQASLPVQTTTPAEITEEPGITILANHDPMIIGDSMVFSGTSTGSSTVVLTLYGPGYYAGGVQLGTERTDTLSGWSYTWNPGSSIQSGTYTMVVNAVQTNATARILFSVIGGGEVSVVSNSYAASRGDTLRFSGRCTTGAQNVELVLFGPERFSSGANLGTISVDADKTWSFRYTLDNAMPTGTYTMYVYDVPRTSSGTTRFTVGFAS